MAAASSMRVCQRAGLKSTTRRYLLLSSAISTNSSMLIGRDASETASSTNGGNRRISCVTVDGTSTERAARINGLATSDGRPSPNCCALPGWQANPKFRVKTTKTPHRFESKFVIFVGLIEIRNPPARLVRTHQAPTLLTSAVGTSQLVPVDTIIYGQSYIRVILGFCILRKPRSMGLAKPRVSRG